MFEHNDRPVSECGSDTNPKKHRSDWTRTRGGKLVWHYYFLIDLEWPTGIMPWACARLPLVAVLALRSHSCIKAGVETKSLQKYIFLGWPTGIEPVIKAPQASVLPLHHGHHASLLPAECMKKSPCCQFSLYISVCIGKYVSHGPIVQRIEHRTSKPITEVRLLLGPPNSTIFSHIVKN